MRSTRVAVRLAAMAAVLMMGTATAQAQPSEQTASQFYMAYRAAFQKATKIDELFPFLGKVQMGQIQVTPADERPKMFELIKLLNSYTNVKVVKETKTATGATLDVEGIDSDKKKSKATVVIIREGGAWKIDKENWTTAA